MSPLFFFQDLESQRESAHLIAVDLGYSEKNRSCGLAWSGCSKPIQLRFGAAVSEVASRLNDQTRPLLVLEAVLSSLHNSSGDPAIRGTFETGRGWYWGPGAVSALAAQRFLSQLAPLLHEPVLLAEAFLSNKLKKTAHREDAATIVREFDEATPVLLDSAVMPLLSLISGVPPVRVFPIGGAYAR